MTKIERKLPQSAVKSAKTPFALAINELLKYKKSSGLLLLAITMSMFLCLFFGMAYHAANTMKENVNLWVNLPKSEVYVTGRLNDAARNYIDQSEYVGTAVYGDYGFGNAKLEGYQDAPDYELYDVYTSFPDEVTGVRMAEGKSPESKYDAAVSVNLLSMLHLNVGDPINLTINNVTNEYTVSGSYETMGTDIMLMADAVSECIDYTPSRAFVWLRDRNDYETFKRDIEGNLPEAVVYREWFALEYTLSATSDMIKPIAIVLIIAFIGFSLLSVLIVLMMDIKNMRKRHGIMKSLGFTADYIIRQNGFKYCVMAVVSAAISLGLHSLFSRKLAAAILLDAFRSSGAQDAVMIIGFILLITVSAITISLPIKKTSPLELMGELE
jgi:cell division protein FtsX